MTLLTGTHFPYRLDNFAYTVTLRRSLVRKRIYSVLNLNSLAEFLDSSRRRLATVHVYTYMCLCIHIYSRTSEYCASPEYPVAVKVIFDAAAAADNVKQLIFVLFLSEYDITYPPYI